MSRSVQEEELRRYAVVFGSSHWHEGVLEVRLHPLLASASLALFGLGCGALAWWGELPIVLQACAVGGALLCAMGSFASFFSKGRLRYDVEAQSLEVLRGSWRGSYRFEGAHQGQLSLVMREIPSEHHGQQSREHEILCVFTHEGHQIPFRIDQAAAKEQAEERLHGWVRKLELPVAREQSLAIEL